MTEDRRVVVCKAYRCRGCWDIFADRDAAEDCNCGLWTGCSELEKKLSKDISNLEGFP